MDNETAARIEIEVAQSKLKFDPIMKMIDGLSLLETASLMATVAGNVQQQITEKFGEEAFSHWWFTVNMGLFKFIPEGALRVEIRTCKEQKGGTA